MATGKRASGAKRARMVELADDDLALLIEIEQAYQIEMGAAQAADEILLGPNLLAALEAAKNARSLIKEAQNLLRAQPYRDNTETERQARQYQLDLIEWQLDRAADSAEKRLRHFETIRTFSDVQAELNKCAADGVAGTLHWFEYYAWGYDPRPDAPLAVMPLEPFPFQQRYLAWLENLVFGLRASGLVEKSRDMGATVLALGWALKQWLFRDGFSAMLTSATEDLVDSKKDPDTLFEKGRFQLRLLPEWMLPSGFNLDRDMTYMNIANPVNGSVITGAAPTGRVGRQRRRTLVIKDEFQAWPQGGFPQQVALSQTAKCQLDIGTPEGRFNQYAVTRHSGNANVFEMDWRDHPWKDERWYKGLEPGYVGPPMTLQAIAQEIDRNYDASQPGKVFGEWREEYCLITWEELIAFYERYGLDKGFYKKDGSFRVPDDWNWGRTSDYGQTAGHPWTVVHAARPGESYPLHDSLFVFSTHVITPTGAAVAQAQEQIEKIEQRLGWRDRGSYVTKDPEFSENSHEADSVRETFLEEHGEYWEPWDTDYNVGIPQIKEWLQVIEPHRANPIRPALNGRTRIYFVAHPTEYKLAFNPKSGKHFITPSKTEAGHKRLREEMPAYHYPPEEAGKPLGKMRPAKILDDVIDCLRAFATHWGPSAEPLGREARIERRLPKRLRAEAVERDEVNVGDGWMMARARARAYAEEQMEKEDLGEFLSAWEGCVSLLCSLILPSLLLGTICAHVC